MDREQALSALRAVQAGELTPEAALGMLAQAPYEDIGYAKIDHHRGMRNGSGEVIYGAGKTMDETFGLIETVEKAAQIYMLTAHLPRVNTIRDDQMIELAEFFGVNYRNDFLDI